MLPFFRKIRYRLAKDNQFLKYSRYAIGEIVLVVVGILIALYINNWNEERKERVKEEHDLTQLKGEFQVTQKELSRVIAKTSDVEKITNLLLSLKEISTESISNEELDSLILRSRGYTIFMSSESTIIELISTGNLGLIRNDTLRSYLASWETSLKPIRGWEVHSKKSVDQLSDLLNQYADNYAYYFFDKSLLSDSERNHLLSDMQCRNYWDDIRRFSEILNELYTEKRATIDRILLLIDQELNASVSATE